MTSTSLGPLEQKIMDFCWRSSNCTTREVFTYLNQSQSLAYNTVQTIMSRLVVKGFLKRVLVGKSYIYSANQKKEAILKKIISKFVKNFINQFGDEAILTFADNLDDISETTRLRLIKRLQQNDSEI